MSVVIRTSCWWLCHMRWLEKHCCFVF